MNDGQLVGLSAPGAAFDHFFRGSITKCSGNNDVRINDILIICRFYTSRLRAKYRRRSKPELEAELEYL